MVKTIMIGDVVGEPGLIALERELPFLIHKYNADLTVVNGENAADGFGLTEQTLNRILQSGADVVTSGNHIWEKREFWSVLEDNKQILRPANYPQNVPGRGWLKIRKNNVYWLVVNLQGRDKMKSIDCPFRTFDTIFMAHGDTNPPVIAVVDFHAESTQEKEAMGFYLDSRASVMAGTHTHVQTADNRILPRGLAYITDIGMTGVQDSIIGMDTQICVDRAVKQVPYHMTCALGESSIQGIVVEINENTGKSLSIKRIGHTASEPD
ncbi:MAG: TIGR00282 family metallophosphoesterase [Treponema sp.]|jgi:metallophosphoesterase (TIGR00282 family)|nr:TIGR00282 family metallophosphoesterase [Treponema sp.]